MSLKDIQKEVDEWTSQFTPQYWPALEQLARLTEETGEIARELNDLHGSKKKKISEDTKELGEELIDSLFTLCCLANSHNIDLQEQWDKVMKEKHYGRDNKRFQAAN